MSISYNSVTYGLPRTDAKFGEFQTTIRSNYGIREKNSPIFNSTGRNDRTNASIDRQSYNFDSEAQR